MKPIHLTVHDASGEVLSLELIRGEYIVGSAEGAHIQIQGEGIAARHVLLSLGDDRMGVEPLVPSVSLNGYPINGRVETLLPASVDLQGVVLVLDWKSKAAQKADPQWKSIQITLPPKAPEPPTPASERSEAGKPDAAAPWDPNAPTVPCPRPGPRFTVDLDKTVVGPRMATPQPSRKAPTGPGGKAPLSGEYTLVREIARGGMGKIYLGEDSQLERPVAVKVSSMASGGADPRFAKEAKVLARLAHPNIVPIYNIGLDGAQRPYYSMKLVKGRTLQAILNALAKKDPDTLAEYTLPALLTIFRKVCDAMAFAHSQHVLHRDLKPENIMVGEYGEVLVMDWGLAKTLGSAETASGSSTGSITTNGDIESLGMTLEGDVMGTPQYMSPEQAEGMVADLDERSDIYSLGAILFAMLTLHPPIEGKTLDEVLTKVRKGEISSMGIKRSSKEKTPLVSSPVMDRQIPEALQAVTLKAMALDRTKRYATVEDFASDLEAYQNGFATSAEGAGLWRKARLWLARNKVLAGSGLFFFIVINAFTAKVIVEGQKASDALKSLKETAPTFAVRAQDALHDGQFEEALKAATFAVSLENERVEYHRIRGDALQVGFRWPEALQEYRLARGDSQAEANLKLTEELIAVSQREGLLRAKVRLFEALNAQGRQYEAMALAKDLGSFWKERKKDPSAIGELVRRLEEKLLPVPGTGILMSKTEFTVGEWKLYLRAEGLPEWKQPDPGLFNQTDEHPVLMVSWEEAVRFCEWLSKATGQVWRLPTRSEWEAAVGTATYPWGDYFPPTSEDGNYSFLSNGKEDPDRIGIDGIKGTAPVASYRPNALGFFDLGGNAWEWVGDSLNEPKGLRLLLGGAWNCSASNARCSSGSSRNPTLVYSDCGFRIILERS